MSAGAIMASGLALYLAAIAVALVAAARGSEAGMLGGLGGSLVAWFGLTGLSFELSGAHGTEFHYLDVAALVFFPFVLAGTALSAAIARMILRRRQAREGAAAEQEA